MEWSVECKVWRVKCGVWSVQRGVWSKECGVCRVSSVVECGVLWSVESVVRGVRSVE